MAYELYLHKAVKNTDFFKVAESFQLNSTMIHMASFYKELIQFVKS